jgi:hypothetical protein
MWPASDSSLPLDGGESGLRLIRGLAAPTLVRIIQRGPHRVRTSSLRLRRARPGGATTGLLDRVESNKRSATAGLVPAER